jgi:hypothetical protein
VSLVDVAPEGVATFLQLGDVVNTPEGPGKVVDIALNLADYNGDVQLEPPTIVVKLDAGPVIHVCLCGLDFGDEFINQRVHDEFSRLWPPMDTVPEAEEIAKTTDGNLELHIGMAQRFNEAVLIGNEVDYFAPAIISFAETNKLPAKDIAVVNGKAYLPVPNDKVKQFPQASRVGVVDKAIELEKNNIPRDRVDDLDLWMKRQFDGHISHFLRVSV